MQKVLIKPRKFVSLFGEKKITLCEQNNVWCKIFQWIGFKFGYITKESIVEEFTEYIEGEIDIHFLLDLIDNYYQYQGEYPEVLYINPKLLFKLKEEILYSGYVDNLNNYFPYTRICCTPTIDKYFIAGKDCIPK